MDSIPNDWEHLLRTETSQKSILNFFCYNNKVIRKAKLSHKEIYFTLHPSVVLTTTNLSNSFHGQTSLN